MMHCMKLTCFPESSINGLKRSRIWVAPVRILFSVYMFRFVCIFSGCAVHEMHVLEF